MRTRLWVASVLVLGGMSGAVRPVAAQEKMLLYAHRGGAYEFEENTMEGFRSSYENGLRGFETDVRMTRDGALVILHDDTLDRTHNGTGPVEHRTAAELRAITTRKKGQPFLFLDELLAYFSDKPGIYLEVELKTRNTELYPDSRLEEYCRKVHDALRARRPRGSSYVLTSFDERPLRIVRRLDADAELMLISGGPCTPELIEQARDLGVQRIACRMDKTSRAAVRAAQKAGLRVNGWPGHTLQDYHLAVGLGVDAFCSDIPVAIHTWRARNQ
jgi:glycerophosphoryl diester phosphodiesterase